MVKCMTSHINSELHTHKMDKDQVVHQDGHHLDYYILKTHCMYCKHCTVQSRKVIGLSEATQATRLMKSSLSELNIFQDYTHTHDTTSNMYIK